MRNGQRFRFNVDGTNVQCADSRDRVYEYGQSNNIDNVSACAEFCVNGVQDSLVNGGSFRGFDMNCSARTCRCLYDAGTLDSRNSNRFDRTNRNPTGRNSIANTVGAQNFICGNLVGAELVEDAVAEA